MKGLLLRLSSWGLKLLLALLIFAVVVVAGARLFVASIPLLQQHITRFLSEQLNTSLQVDQLYASWQGGMPTLTVRGLKLQGNEASQPGFIIDRVDLELDFRSTLLYRTPVFNSLEMDGVIVEIIQTADGRWRLSGIDGIGADNVGKERYNKPSLLDWLRFQGYIDITNTSLIVLRPGGEIATLRTPYFALVNDNGLKRFDTRLELGTGSVEISGQGQGIDFRGLGWKGNISVQNFDFEQLCLMWRGCNDRVEKVLMASELDWLYQKGQWQLSGELAFPEVSYLSGSANENSHSLTVTSSLFFEGVKGENWKMWLDNLSVSVDQKEPVLTSWFLKGEKKPEYNITIANQTLDLRKVKQLLLGTELLSDLPVELLTVLNPVGQLNNIAMRLYPQQKPFDFDLSAELVDVSVDAWEGAPSAAHVSGDLRMNLLKGSLELSSNKFSLGFPRIFRKSWNYSSAQSKLFWDVVDDTYILRSNKIQLNGPEGVLNGQLRLDIPLDEKPIGMALAVGIRNGNAQYAKKYIPAKLDGLSPELVGWLDSAIKQADINEGGFLYNGSLQNIGIDHDSRWGLYFNIADAQLDYHKDWPVVGRLYGDVYVNDDRVEVLGDSANIIGADLYNTTARVGLTDDTVIEIKSELTARGASLHRFLTETPVNELMEGEAKIWKLSGDLESQVQLKIPLSHVEDTEVDVKGRVGNYQLSLPEYNITINKINGDVAFNTANGFSSGGLSGKFLGQTVKATVKTFVGGRNPKETHIHWQGNASVQTLEQFFQLDALSLLDGEASYSAELRIDHSKRATDILINSNLEGIEIELPAPLGKVSEKPLPMTLAYEIRPDASILSTNLIGIGKGRIDFGADYSVRKASFLLGSALGADEKIPEAVKNSLRITGDIPELDIGPWYERFSNQPASAKERSLSGLIDVDGLKIGRLLYKDTVLENLLVSLKPDEQFLKLAIQSPSLTGSLWIPDRESVPYRLVLDDLVLPSSEGQDEATGDQDKPILSMAPEALPAADISINSLTAGKMKGGQLSFKVRQAPDGIRLESIQGHFSDMQLTGSADWVERQGEQYTYFQGRLQGSGIDKLQEAFGITPFAQAKKTRMEGTFGWPGSPLDIGFAAIKGTIAVDMDNGRLKKLEGGAGALKLFGILNTESLMRRLKLDFSDLYASGLSFDDLNGILRFNKGVVTFDSPIVIEGPSSNFKLDGIVDSVKENMDVSLVVTLPVTSNLPIFSVLLGAAPQVAGIFYLADKLVGKQVDQLASIRYRIEGSFDEPKVSLDQLFSNKAVKPGQKKSTPIGKEPKQK